LLSDPPCYLPSSNRQLDDQELPYRILPPWGRKFTVDDIRTSAEGRAMTGGGTAPRLAMEVVVRLVCGIVLVNAADQPWQRSDGDQQAKGKE